MNLLRPWLLASDVGIACDTRAFAPDPAANAGGEAALPRAARSGGGRRPFES